MSLGLGLFLSARGALGPSAISLNYTQADVLGGGSDITLTGTALSGATLLTVGGTSATITGNTATTVTFTPPAKAAGTYDVVVTTPLGTSTLFAAYEAWAPSTEAGCTLFCERPNYAVAAGNGTWTARVGTNPTHATLGPAASAGSPAYDGTNHRLDAAAISGIIKTTSVQAGSFAAIVNMNAPLVAPGGAAFSSVGLWSDQGRGAIGVRMTTSGFGAFYFDGVYKETTVPIVAGSARAYASRFLQNDTVQASVNGSAFSAASTALGNATTGNTTEVVQLGTNYDGTLRVNATVLAVVFHNVKVSDAFATKFYKWSQQRHGVT